MANTSQVMPAGAVAETVTHFVAQSQVFAERVWRSMVDMVTAHLQVDGLR
jgi:hypothetical protein